MRPAAFLVPFLLALAGCVDAAPNDPDDPSPTPSIACAAKTFREADVNVTIETTKGQIGAVLHGAKAPLTVCNLLLYIESDYYDNTIWHRICSHVIQAGGINANGQAKPARDPIPNEANQSQLRNYQRSLGMARNSEPNSAQAHFYVNLKDNLYLDYDGQYAPGYAVFGNVTRGWEVVQEIARTPVQPTPPSLANPLAPPGCNGQPVPSQETTIRDIQIET